MISLRTIGAAFWLALVFPGTGAARAETLPPSPEPRYVLDEPGWLPRASFESIDDRLESYERETSNQLVVAIFRGIPPGGDAFDFSQRVFEKWKPGQKDKDNGVILFVFAADRELRIHTGYGLEGALPDARCKQIIANEIVPRLRANDREGAIRAGVEAIIAASKGEYKGSGRTHRELIPNEVATWVIIIGIILLFTILEMLRRGGPDDVYTGSGRRTGGWGGGWGGGGGFGGGGFGGGGGFSGGGGSSGGGGAGGSW